VAFNLEEWNKLSDAERERRYRQRHRDKERGKTLAAVVAFVLLVWLLIAVHRASPKNTVVEPGAAIYERERANLGSHSAAAHRLGMHRNTLYDWLEWAREHVTK